MTINLNQCNSSNYQAGRVATIRYIVIHYTGNNGDTALNNSVYFANNEKLNASAHYFVDEEEVWQSVKDENTAWHCGTDGVYKHSTCRNENSISVELCSRKATNGQFYFKEKTIENAINLVRILMRKYNIPLENVIRHYDVTGKICPQPFVNDASQWTSFKKRIIETEDEYMMQETFNEMMKVYEAEKAQKMVSDWAKESWEKAKNAGVFDGSMPQSPMTREQAAAVFNRLGIIK